MFEILEMRGRIHSIHGPHATGTQKYKSERLNEKLDNCFPEMSWLTLHSLELIYEKMYI